MNLRWDDGCFVCGKANADGLRLDFEVDEAQRTIETEWVPPAAFQGYTGVLHGGIVATLLDEALGKLSTCLDLPAVTGELTVRFHKPVPTGKSLRVRGRITQSKRRLLLGEAEAILEDGSVAARATAKLMREES